MPTALSLAPLALKNWILSDSTSNS